MSVGAPHTTEILRQGADILPIKQHLALLQAFTPHQARRVVVSARAHRADQVVTLPRGTCRETP